MTDIIQLTDTWRIRYGQDTDAQNPRTEGDYILTGALYIGTQDREVAPVFEFPGDLERAVMYIPGERRGKGVEVAPGKKVYLHVGLANVIRWAKIFHGIHLHEADDTLWWVDRDALIEGFGEEPAASVLAGTYLNHRGEPITEQMLIESEVETYRQWAEGEVIFFVIERAVTFFRDPDDDEPDGPASITVWEEIESLYGVYLNGRAGDEEMQVALAVAEQIDLLDQPASQALRRMAGLN